jgi:hypothetical protein
MSSDGKRLFISMNAQSSLRVKQPIAALCVAFMIAADCPGETTSGTIVGHVRDRAGDGIPDAIVRIIWIQASCPGYGSLEEVVRPPS